MVPHLRGAPSCSTFVPHLREAPPSSTPVVPFPVLPPLSCTVRGCGRDLVRTDRAWRCANGHAFDTAREGYVNLLQPQDRKASAPGDAREAVAARAALLSAGVGMTLIDAVTMRVARVAAHRLRPGAVVVDLGSGSGDALAAVVSHAGMTGVGIDISAAAAAHAARRWPAITWVVANADRRLPLADGSVDVVLSLHARRSPAECARVLTAGGTLIVAVPAPDDLAELRAAIQGEATPRDRVAALVEEHAGLFSVEERFDTRESHGLDAAQVQALLRATYRGARSREAARAATLAGITVTLASDGMVLKRG